MAITQDRRTLVGIVFFIAAMQAVPVTDAMAKLLSQAFPVLMVVFLRTATQSVFLLAIGVATKGGGFFRRDAIVGRHHVLRGFLWWVSTVLFFYAIRDHDIPGALALFFTGPIFVAATAPILLKEKFDRRFLLAAVAGFVGVLFILSPDLSGIQVGMLPALLSGICYGSYLMGTRHAAQDKSLGAAEIAFGAGLWASVIGLPLALFLWQEPSFYSWLLILVMGSFSALGHLLIALASQRTDASKLSPFSYTEMIAAIVASQLIFGTLPTAGTWVGIALIVAAGVWAALSSRQRTVDAIV